MKCCSAAPRDFFLEILRQHIMGREPGVGPEQLYSIAPKVVVSPFAPLEICRNGSGFFRIDNKISPWKQICQGGFTLKTPEITILRQEPQQYATFSIASYILHAKIFTIFC